MHMVTSIPTLHHQLLITLESKCNAAFLTFAVEREHSLLVPQESNWRGEERGGGGGGRIMEGCVVLAQCPAGPSSLCAAERAGPPRVLLHKYLHYATDQCLNGY